MQTAALMARSAELLQELDEALAHARNADAAEPSPWRRLGYIRALQFTQLAFYIVLGSLLGILLAMALGGDW